MGGALDAIRGSVAWTEVVVADAVGIEVASALEVEGAVEAEGAGVGEDAGVSAREAGEDGEPEGDECDAGASAAGAWASLDGT